MNLQNKLINETRCSHCGKYIDPVNETDKMTQPQTLCGFPVVVAKCDCLFSKMTGPIIFGEF